MRMSLLTFFTKHFDCFGDLVFVFAFAFVFVLVFVFDMSTFLQTNIIALIVLEIW